MAPCRIVHGVGFQMRQCRDLSRMKDAASFCSTCPCGERSSRERQGAEPLDHRAEHIVGGHDEAAGAAAPRWRRCVGLASAAAGKGQRPVGRATMLDHRAGHDVAVGGGGYTTFYLLGMSLLTH